MKTGNHWSDCALHNEPAMPAGECNCGANAPDKKINLLETVDPVIWAEEFERHKIRNGWTIDDIDESLMLTWFCNFKVAQELNNEPTPIN